MTKFPWFRFYPEMIDDQKIVYLSRKLMMPKFAVIGIWAMLLSRASNSPIRGALYFTEALAYNEEDLAVDFDMDLDRWRLIQATFFEMGLLEYVDGAIRVKNWDKRQYTSDHSASRVAKFRKEKKEQQQELPNQLEKRDCNVTSLLHVTGDSVSVSDSESINNKTLKSQSVQEKAPNYSIPNILSRAAGMSFIPPKESERAEQIRSLIDVHGPERVEAALKNAADTWRSTRGKNGSYYRITNMAWVDKAQDELDKGTPARPMSEWSVEEVEAYYAGRDA